jgi:hypothetical protein
MFSEIQTGWEFDSNYGNNSGGRIHQIEEGR